MLSVEKEKLQNANLTMLPEIMAEFRRLGDTFGDRNKLRWTIASAAILKLLECSEGEIEALVQELLAAKPFPDKRKWLVERAKDAARQKGSRRSIMQGTSPLAHAPTLKRRHPRE